MKPIHFAVASCSLFLPLVSADLLLNTTRIFGGGGNPDQCNPPRDEEECVAIENCVWISAVGQCFYKEAEGCGFAQEKSSCETLSDCVWMTEVNDDRRGTCMEMEEISESTNCRVDGFEITSKDSCNSVKGCSWIGVGDAKSCEVALTQLNCDIFPTRSTCIREGCVYKKRKCGGRWEPQFLASLIGMDGLDAKQAIKDEYGERTYKVALIKPRRKRPKNKKRNRIRLYLDEEGLVKSSPAPKFG